tara:strand:- start:23853 stop:24065 length:213 start_codon:yes stop_codon:yes gene_type:complete
MSLIDKIKLEKLFIKLFPLPRSISGEGLRESFNILSMSYGFTSKKYVAKKFDIENQIIDILLKNDILIKV